MTGVTANYCRQQATKAAAQIETQHYTDRQNMLANTAMAWAQLGQLCLALGDPDEDVVVVRRRRESLS